MSEKGRLILLDAGPLGLATIPKASEQSRRCKAWLKGLLDAGVRVMVPVLAEYEVTRELLRAGKHPGANHVYQLASQLGRLPVNERVVPIAGWPGHRTGVRVAERQEASGVPPRVSSDRADPGPLVAPRPGRVPRPCYLAFSDTWHFS